MLAALTGQRLLFNYMRIGGVNGDLNHEFLSRLGDWMSHADRAHRGRHRRSSTRTRSSSAGRAAWDASTARRRCGCASPARPCAPPGVPYDVRRAHPYSVYPELEFDIPTRNEGDSYARYLLHLDEIKQSIRIIDQVPPPDARRAGHGQAAAPAAAAAGARLGGHREPARPVRRYAISDGTDQPFRLRIHDPSFFTSRRSAC